jgi:hypothetical protein
MKGARLLATPVRRAPVLRLCAVGMQLRHVVQFVQSPKKYSEILRLSAYQGILLS